MKKNHKEKNNYGEKKILLIYELIYFRERYYFKMLNFFLPNRRSYQDDLSCDHMATTIIANSCGMIYKRKCF